MRCTGTFSLICPHCANAQAFPCSILSDWTKTSYVVNSGQDIEHHANAIVTCSKCQRTSEVSATIWINDTTGIQESFEFSDSQKIINQCICSE